MNNAENDALFEECMRAFKEHWLLTRASMWIQVASMCSVRRIADGADRQWREFQNLHAPLQAVNALWHLSRCIENLEALGGELNEALWIALRELKERLDSIDIKEARDALEHIEDRVTGLNMGRHPSKLHPEPVAEFFPDVTEEDGKLAGITVLNRNFRVLEVTALAVAIEDQIFAEAEAILDKANNLAERYMLTRPEGDEPSAEHSPD